MGRWGIVLALVLSTLWSTVTLWSNAEQGSAPASEVATRGAMQQVLAALAVTFPDSLDADRFAAPERRAQVLERLALLRDSTRALESHVQARDPGLSYLGGSLVFDAQEVYRRYAEGRHWEARYFLHRLTETCVACHSSLPDDGTAPFAEQLLANVQVGELPARERARLEVATRQFDRALEHFEALLVDPDVAPAKLDVDGDLMTYLTVGVRVRQDYARARQALVEFERRPDLSASLRRHVGAWVASLRDLEKLGRLTEGPSLVHARALIARSKQARAYPADRAGLVYDLAASGELHRYVDARPERAVERAEALYLLGVTDAWAAATWWVSPADFYLESAIRAAPDSEAARAAYAMLEARTIEGYTGSAGVNLPREVEHYLRDLRELLASPTAPPGSGEPDPIE